jgi:hypothetical protein
MKFGECLQLFKTEYFSSGLLSESVNVKVKITEDYIVNLFLFVWV